MQDNDPIKIELSCPCGWQGETEVLSAGANDGSGKMVGCKKCDMVLQSILVPSIIGGNHIEWKLIMPFSQYQKEQPLS